MKIKEESFYKAKRNPKVEKTPLFKDLTKLQENEPWFTEEEKKAVDKFAKKKLYPIFIIDSNFYNPSFASKYKDFVRIAGKKLEKDYIYQSYSEKDENNFRTIMFGDTELADIFNDVRRNPLLSEFNKSTKNIFKSTTLYRIANGKPEIIKTSNPNTIKFLENKHKLVKNIVESSKAKNSSYDKSHNEPCL